MQECQSQYLFVELEDEILDSHMRVTAAVQIVPVSLSWDAVGPPNSLLV